jgi:hypothetical protein
MIEYCMEVESMKIDGKRKHDKDRCIYFLAGILRIDLPSMLTVLP